MCIDAFWKGPKTRITSDSGNICCLSKKTTRQIRFCSQVEVSVVSGSLCMALCVCQNLSNGACGRTCNWSYTFTGPKTRSNMDEVCARCCNEVLCHEESLYIFIACTKNKGNNGSLFGFGSKLWVLERCRLT